MRYPVPRDVQALRGKRYERRSCSTEDPRQARLVAAKLVAQWEQEYQRLRDSAAALTPPLVEAKSTPLSDELIEQICHRWYGSSIRSDDSETRAFRPKNLMNWRPISNRSNETPGRLLHKAKAHQAIQSSKMRLSSLRKPWGWT
ncbi:DUF6538 domain-containing protein [Achromobacter sp. ACM05]|uniref:DUF6538 domain-containing protein n=1 Tax=Achromobacter sp. ACM05 TaxID=2854776 RepID=UPI00351D6A0A